MAGKYTHNRQASTMATPEAANTVSVAKKNNNNYGVLLEALKPSAISITDDYIGVRQEQQNFIRRQGSNERQKQSEQGQFSENALVKQGKKASSKYDFILCGETGIPNMSRTIDDDQVRKSLQEPSVQDREPLEPMLINKPLVTQPEDNLERQVRILDQTIINDGQLKTIESSDIDQDAATPQIGLSRNPGNEIIIYDELLQEATISLQPDAEKTTEVMTCDQQKLLNKSASESLKATPTASGRKRACRSFMRPTISSSIKKEILIGQKSERQETKSSRYQTPKQRDSLSKRHLQNPSILSPGLAVTTSPGPSESLSAAKSSLIAANSNINKQQSSCCAITFKEGKNHTIDNNKQTELHNSLSSPVIQPKSDTISQQNNQEEHQHCSSQTLEEMRSQNNQYGVMNTHNHRAFLHNMIMQGALPGQINYLDSSQSIANQSNFSETGGLLKSSKYVANASSHNAASMKAKSGHQMAHSRQRKNHGPNHPAFVPAITRSNAGRLAQSDQHDNYYIKTDENNKQLDTSSENVVVGRIQLQEILDEVASIEQRYGGGGSVSRDEGSTKMSRTKTEESTADFNNLNDAKKRADPLAATSKRRFHDVMNSAGNPYALRKGQHRVETSTDRRPNVAASQYSAPDSFQAKKGSTGQQRWQHKHQQSMKLTSTSSQVTSPRKPIKQRNTSNNKQAQQAQSYITYKNGLQHQQQLGDKNNISSAGGRKSLNFPVRNLQPAKKQTIAPQSEYHGLDLQEIDLDSHAQLNLTPLVTKHEMMENAQNKISQQAQAIASQIGVAKSPTDATAVQSKQLIENTSKLFHPKPQTKQERTIEIIENATPSAEINNGSSLSSFHQSSKTQQYNKEASKRIKTDQDQFGSFVIATQNNHVVNADACRMNDMNAPQTTKSRTSNTQQQVASPKYQHPQQINQNLVHLVENKSGISSGRNSRTPDNWHNGVRSPSRIAQSNILNSVLNASSSATPLTGQQATAIVDEQMQRFFSTGSVRPNTNCKSRINTDYPQDHPQDPISCLSPEISQAQPVAGSTEQTKKSSIFGQFVNQEVSPILLQDIQRGCLKLERTLLNRRDSVFNTGSQIEAGAQSHDIVAGSQKISSSAGFQSSKVNNNRNTQQPDSSSNYNVRNMRGSDKRQSVGASGKAVGVAASAATTTGNFKNQRASKSPLQTHNKKTTTNSGHWQSSQYANQKQSLKQLGLSYGIIAKKDIMNKLVSSKKRHAAHSKETSPKKAAKDKKNAAANLFKLDEENVNDIHAEGNQITYDEQTALSPNNINNQHSNIQHVFDFRAKSHNRFNQNQKQTQQDPMPQSQSKVKGIEGSALQHKNQSMVSSPSRYSAVKQLNNQNNTPQVAVSSIQQAVNNQLIMKRMPELHAAPSAAATSSNFSSQFLPQTQRGRLFKYQVINGNNSALVKKVMTETRSFLWMEMANNQQSHFHFRWSPISRNVNFERLSHNFGQMVNHFEHHHEITTKNELFKNLKSHHDEKLSNAFNMIPLTFCLKISADRQNQSIKQQLKPFKEVFNLLEEFKEHCDPEKSIAAQLEPQKQESQMDATPNTSTENLGSQVLQPFDQLISNPLSVLITKKGKEIGYRDIVSNKQGDSGPRIRQFTSKSSGLTMPMCHFVGQNVWILKPTGFNRGKGIHVVNSLSKLKKLIKEYSRGKEASTSTIGLSGAVPSGTIYPTSKFMAEPQALETKQLMMATQSSSMTTGATLSSSKQQSRKSLGLGSMKSPQLPKFMKGQGAQSQSPSKGDSSHKALSKINDIPMTITQLGNKQQPTPSLLKKKSKVGDAEVVPVSTEDADETNFEKHLSDTMTTIEENTQQTPMADKSTKTAPSTVVMSLKTDAAKSVPQSSMHNSCLGYQKPSIRSSTFIIQKYIERPLLVNKRKFDIRVWVALTQDMDMYFFKEGYLRTSSRPYDMTAQNLDDDFVHLTNNAIQKNSPDYGNHEDGNMLSFPDFKKLIQKSGVKVNFQKDIVQKMQYLCAQTLHTIRKKINPNRRKHCFELFGFDYFIDIDYNVFLIEVNTNPCLEESSRLLQMLMPRMLDDLFKLTIDQIFLPTKDIVVSQQQSQLQPSVNKQISHSKTASSTTTSNTHQISKQASLLASKSIYSVTGYRDSENMWEKIGTMKQNASVPIIVDNPHTKQGSKSEKIIHLVNQYEMRVAKPDLVEKGIKRDLQQNGTNQTSGFADY